MPWTQTDAMCERAKFIFTFKEGVYSMTELCERYGISRKTGYKWLSRYEAGGLEGLREQSRAPRSIPHRTLKETEDALVELRKKRPSWGARKLLTRLKSTRPELTLPAPSTVTALLYRHDLVKPRRRQRKPQHPGSKPLEAAGPNDVWTMDFKGEFLLGNKRYCYPLTVCDATTRFLLSCTGLPSTKGVPAMEVIERLFREHGLPTAIRTDNGSPFATQAIGGLSRLSIYWLKLGIRHDRIDPSSPQQNGRHERMHRTLKAETTRPPETTFEAQQHRFDAFRYVFNQERPHEALGMDTPADHYQSSTRNMPGALPQPEYLGHMEVRRVGSNGSFKFKGHVLFLSETLSGEHIALDEIDNGIWSIYFANLLLGRLNERTFTITP